LRSERKGFQFLYQAGRLARRDDELYAPLLIGLDCLSTVETRSEPSVSMRSDDRGVKNTGGRADYSAPAFR
jgi:hypothetical protein